MDNRSRRAVLRAGAVTMAGLAGCTAGRSDTASREGHLFVTNPTSETERLLLTVTAKPEGERLSIIDATYWAPPGKTLQFEGIMEPGRKYAIEANLRGGGPSDSVEVTVETCSGDGQMDVRVRAEPDAVGIVPYGCDRAAPDSEEPYVDPSEYRVTRDAATGTP